MLDWANVQSHEQCTDFFPNNSVFKGGTFRALYSRGGGGHVPLVPTWFLRLCTVDDPLDRGKEGMKGRMHGKPSS